MARPLRIYSPGATVEVMTRTLNHGMYLLPPTPEYAGIAVGVLAKAQERYPVRIHAAAMLSNHYHLILTIDDSKQLADFMGYVNGNLAGEANRITEWKGTIWSDRYHATEITHEEGVMEERLRYVLSHSVKEGLTERVEDWEGLHSGPAMRSGRPMHGVWYDRTTKYNAGRRGKEIEREAWVQDLQLRLTPPPCWAHLSPSQQRSRAAAMIAEIEAEAASKRTGPVLGMAAVQAQGYTERPAQAEKRSPIPLVHAGSKRVREIYKAAYRTFAEQFRKASIALRQGGDLTAVFPRWSFPPARAYVRQGDDFTAAAVLAAGIL